MTSPGEPAACGEILHRHGLKNTPARRQVLRLLREGVVLTADDIGERLRDEGRTPDPSTLYRILDLFTARGLAERHYLPDLRKYGFSLKAAGHRHRLICVRCRRVVEIDRCPLEAFEKELRETTRFAITGHNLEWYGLCPDCQAAEARRAESPPNKSGPDGKAQ